MDAGMLAAAQAVEHYEIARYGTMRAWAEELGMNDAASCCSRRSTKRRRRTSSCPRSPSPASTAKRPEPRRNVRSVSRAMPPSRYQRTGRPAGLRSFMAPELRARRRGRTGARGAGRPSAGATAARRLERGRRLELGLRHLQDDAIRHAAVVVVRGGRVGRCARAGISGVAGGRRGGVAGGVLLRAEVDPVVVGVPVPDVICGRALKSRDWKGTATSFSPIPRKPPTPITTAIACPLRSTITSFTSPIDSLFELTTVVPMRLDAIIWFGCIITTN